MRAYPFKAGDRYGHWELIREIPSEKHHRLCEARCSCGVVKVVNLASVRAGQSRSCGRCRKALRTRKHGMWKSAEYRTWSELKQRCSNPKKPCYVNYGGRGITVCLRWLESFENFYADMGPRPSPRHSIDRVDNNGNYEPGNCRWATTSEQRRNKNATRLERVVRLLLGQESDRVLKLLSTQTTDRQIADELARHIAHVYRQGFAA